MFDAVNAADELARGRAGDALAAFVGKGDLEAVAKAARDPRPRVRVKALRLLEKFNKHSAAEPPDLGAILEEALRHPNVEVRYTAGHVAVHFVAQYPSLVPVLRKALDDPAAGQEPNMVPAASAAYALGFAGRKGRPAYAALMRVGVQHKSGSVRRYATGAIAHLAAADLEQRPLLLGFVLKRLRQAPHFRDRAAAAGSISYLGRDGAVALPALREAFRCKDFKDAEERECIRDFILFTYTMIGPAAKETLADLLPVLTDPKEHRRTRNQIVLFVRSLKRDGAKAWEAMRKIEADPGEDVMIRNSIKVAFQFIAAEK